MAFTIKVNGGKMFKNFKKLFYILYGILVNKFTNIPVSAERNFVNVEPTKQTVFPIMPFSIDKTKSRNWLGIVVHHSGSEDGITRDADEIIKYHTSYRVDYNIVTKEEFYRRKLIGNGKKFELPWQCVGYNYLLEYIDDKIVINTGRPLWLVGAHAGYSMPGYPSTNYYNENYLGVCMIGNFDLQVPSKEIFNTVSRFCKGLMNVFNIPKEKVIGHREVFDELKVPKYKLCPGKFWDMDSFRKLL
jgi:hypothetical protein